MISSTNVEYGAEYDYEVLKEVKLANRRKRGDLSMGDVIILQGNARLNYAALTQQKIQKLD